MWSMFKHLSLNSQRIVPIVSSSRLHPVAKTIVSFTSDVQEHFLQLWIHHTTSIHPTIKRTNTRNNIPELSNIGLIVSFDMAWQKRGSGNRYDSISGHVLMIGCVTKKVI